MDSSTNLYVKNKWGQNKWGQSQVPEFLLWHLTLTPALLTLALDSDPGIMTPALPYRFSAAKVSQDARSPDSNPFLNHFTR